MKIDDYVSNSLKSGGHRINLVSVIIQLPFRDHTPLFCYHLVEQKMSCGRRPHSENGYFFIFQNGFKMVPVGSRYV